MPSYSYCLSGRAILPGNCCMWMAAMSTSTGQSIKWLFNHHAHFAEFIDALAHQLFHRLFLEGGYVSEELLFYRFRNFLRVVVGATEGFLDNPIDKAIFRH